MNKSYTLGFDEVGRGSLAGPVTVGLVALESSFPLLTQHFDTNSYPSIHTPLAIVRDSKVLNEEKRKQVCQLIQDFQLPSVTLSASNTLIDDFGIGVCLQHLLLIGFNVFEDLPITKILVDGTVYFPKNLNNELVQKIIDENNLDLHSLTFPFTGISVINENKADDKYLCIALASCLAKVTRDEFMSEQSRLYPVYNWITNKGYGTANHRKAIFENSQNPLLRRTFIKNIINEGIKFDNH